MATAHRHPETHSTSSSLAHKDDTTVRLVLPNGAAYEILTTYGDAVKYKEGHVTDFRSVLAIDELFVGHVRDARRADQAEIEAHFGEGTSKLDAIKRVLEQGTIQMSKGEMDKEKKQRLQHLVNYIHENYIDSATHEPVQEEKIHELVMTLQNKHHAFQQMLSKPLAEAASEAVDAIRKHLGAASPKLHKAIITAKITLAVQQLGKALGVLKRYVQEVVKEEEDANTFMTYEFTILPGEMVLLQNELQTLLKTTEIDMQIINVQIADYEILGASTNKPSKDNPNVIYLNHEKFGRRLHELHARNKAKRMAVQDFSVTGAA